MPKFIQKGEHINYINNGTETIKYGSTVVLTGRIAIADSDIAVGSTGSISVSGVFEFSAETTAAFTQGQDIYWDITNKVATGTSTSNTKIGYAVAAKAQNAAAALVKLGG